MIPALLCSTVCVSADVGNSVYPAYWSARQIVATPLDTSEEPQEKYAIPLLFIVLFCIASAVNVLDLDLNIS